MADSVPVPPRPASAVSHGVGLAGLVGLLIWFVIAREFAMSGPLAALAALVACGGPMIAWSLLVDKVHLNPSTGIDWLRPARSWNEAAETAFVKIVGLWAIWGLIAGVYCIARWYWRDPYLFAMQSFAVAIVPMVILSVPYVLWLDRRLVQPKDGAWQFGQLILNRPGAVDRELLYDFFRSWAIKAFFLAFMLAIVPGNWRDAVGRDAASFLADPVALAQWLITIMFMVDVCLATVGYVCTLKIFDAHIRSANPYAAGWMAALLCYPPFIMMGPGGPLDYHPGTAEWTQWLANYPVVAAINGAWLVFLTGVYAWATVAFGLRFSNLTHRGILTHGPYAFSKHPAYLSKNLFWWFATMPFFATTGSIVDMIRNTAILALVSGVYYWRARTEERHLRADPDYVAYAEWMERHGPVPRFMRSLAGLPPVKPAPRETTVPAE